MQNNDFFELEAKFLQIAEASVDLRAVRLALDAADVFRALASVSGGGPEWDECVAAAKRLAAKNEAICQYLNKNLYGMPSKSF